MAKPQKRSNGNWLIQWVDEHGKRRTKTLATHREAKERLAKEEVTVAKIKKGYQRPISTRTLKDLSEGWLEARPKKRRTDDDSALRMHILPALGKHKLHDITPDVLERFTRQLEEKKTQRKFVDKKDAKPLAASTIKKVLVVLGKMLGDLGYQIKMPRFKVPTSGYAWISDPAEVAKFIENAKPRWFQIAASLSLYGGLRKGEVAGLRWEALDYERGLIRVDKSYEGPVKSKHLRWAPLSPELAKVLKRWRMESGGGTHVVRRPPAEGETHGKLITSAYDLSKFARRACKRAGLSVNINFHQLRHTAASHLALRVPLPLVGAVLGHADPKTTARYAHLDTEGVSRDERLHLNFAPGSGKVLTGSEAQFGLSASGSASGGGSDDGSAA